MRHVRTPFPAAPTPHHRLQAEATRQSGPIDNISSASGAQLASSLIWKSVTRQPPPTRQGIIPRDGTRDDGQRERDDGKSPDFEVNLGKVISTLREDYPRIFFDPPSFDIYTEEIELRDPVRSNDNDQWWVLVFFGGERVVICTPLRSRRQQK